MGLDHWVIKNYSINQYSFNQYEADFVLTGQINVYNSDTIEKRTKNVYFALSKDAICNISTQVITWRKCNWFHAYFVNKFADGIDDCKPILITQDNIRDFISDLQTIKTAFETEPLEKAKQIADELMPPEAGFFFGGTEIDEWYFQSIGEANHVFSKSIEENTDIPFCYEYQASW
jgi:hypothetical protein